MKRHPEANTEFIQGFKVTLMTMGTGSNKKVDILSQAQNGSRQGLLVNNVCNVMGLRKDLKDMSFVADFFTTVMSTLESDDILLSAAKKLYEHYRYNLLIFSRWKGIDGSSKAFYPDNSESAYYNAAEILLKFPGLAANNIWNFSSFGIPSKNVCESSETEYLFELPDDAGYITIIADENFPRYSSEFFPSRMLESLSIALRNSERYGKVKEQSMRDSLTGLYNRRVLEEMLDREDRKRGINPLSLLIIDLDDFKNINDTYGHPCGDRALKAIAAVLSDNARGTDLVARNGGEEFAVMLPSTSASIGLEVGERLRKNIENTTIMCNGVRISLTASIGVSHRPRKEYFPAKDMISLADQALYQAKNSGKNRVCFFSSSPVLVESK
jgi:two-component system cell cycle response regulator